MKENYGIKFLSTLLIHKECAIVLLAITYIEVKENIAS